MRYMQDLQRSFKLKLSRFFFRGSEKRHLQEQIDVHRLFLFTSLHAQRQQLPGGQLPDDFTQLLIEQAKTLPFPEQRSIVHRQLQGQLANIASCIHSCLSEARDPRPSATALEQAWARRHGSRSSSASSFPAGEAAAATAAAGEAATGPLLSQAQLSQLVQQKLGFSLAVQPSTLAHQEAGQGLFVQGQVEPGALLALFPGLVYHKANYRRMPGYPRIDVGNPFLTSRYDGGVVDSLPWGRGWAADQQQQQQQQPAPITAGPRKGLIGRMIAASDGSRRPIPATAWVRATTAEAAHLELLEGRHPLALAHIANHPPAGTAPNAVIASFNFSLAAQEGSSSSSGSGNDSQAEPWVRAYVPNINYCEDCSPEHLLTHEVACVGLVAVAPLAAGSEVFFNYRLSPALLGRPAWYAPVDQEEENNRWA